MYKLRDYQLQAVKYTDTVEHPAFFVEMRLGKNLMTIRSIKRRYKNPKVLIITSYSAFDGWQDDLQHEFKNTALEITGPKHIREEQLGFGIHPHTEFGWCIINWEGLKVIPEVGYLNWDVVVADESKRMAHIKTKTSKFCAKFFRNAKTRFILTGTPDHHDNLDYYQQLKFLNPEILRAYPTYWSFINNAFYVHGFDRIMKPEHKIYLQQQLAKYCFFLKRKDVNMGRTKVYKRIVVDFDSKLRKKYSTIEKEYVLEGDKTKSTIYAPVSYGWMMQLCGGFIEDSFVFDGKLKELNELFENDLRDEQVVIVCRHRHEIKMLSEKLEDSRFIHGDVQMPIRRNLSKAFNKKEFKRLIVQAETVKHGKDFSAATTLIFYSQPNGQESREQVEDRIITMADEKVCLVIDLLVKNTVDYDSRMSHILGESKREMFLRAVRRNAK